MKYKFILVAIVTVFVISGCNSTPTKNGSEAEEARSFTTEDPYIEDPVVVFYSVIPKSLLKNFLECEKSLSKKRLADGLRPIRVTTDKMEAFSAKASDWRFYIRGSFDPQEFNARIELEQCAKGY